jgi:hypothetical protein
MKNVVFCEVALCRSWIRGFGGTCRLQPRSSVALDFSPTLTDTRPLIDIPLLPVCFRLEAQSAPTC